MHQSRSGWNKDYKILRRGRQCVKKLLSISYFIEDLLHISRMKFIMRKLSLRVTKKAVNLYYWDPESAVCKIFYIHTIQGWHTSITPPH
jgi:hypothetical protein